MAKFIFLVLCGYLLYRALVRAPNGKARRTAASEAMVQCAYCRLHIPQQESLPEGDKYYCCEEHRRLGRG